MIRSLCTIPAQHASSGATGGAFLCSGMKTIEQLAEERILVLDGAMGTMIQRLGLTEEDFHQKVME